MAAEVVEIPTRNDLPIYLYTVSLDGVNFTLKYTYNDRMGKWFVNLADANNNTIISQVPVIASLALFDRFIAAAIPAGTVVPWDTSGQNMDPGRYDLGDRVRMFYCEQGFL